MLQLSRALGRRVAKASVNPIKQADLVRLKTWSREGLFAYQKMASKDLPDAFGFDKNGLMVNKEFTIDLPKSDGAGTTKAPAEAETNSADTT